MIFFINLSYATYPQFEFVPLNFEAGQVDIVGRVSSGTQVELFINNLTLGTYDAIANQTLIILDGSSIQNQILPYGSTIVFRNEGPRNYQLNISGTYKELSYGQELSYVGNTIGDLMYSDNIEGVSRVISVVDTLTDFSYNYVNDYLENGDNQLKFILKYPYLTYTNQSAFEYTINFQKYINDITVSNFTNITNKHSANITGYVESVTYPMYYLVNINPKDLGNIGALNSVTLTGDKFNISVDNLQEGENNIYLITTDPVNQNIFTGVQRVQIFVDTIPPTLNVKRVTFEKSGSTYRVDFGSEIYINGNRLLLEIETDAVLLNYTFNNQTYSQEVLNGSINITLSLNDGLNPLVLEPIDIAGNRIKEAHNLYFDDKEPTIIRESLKPEEMFKNDIVHFFFQNIEGKTNKPEVSLTIFTIPYGAKTMDGTSVSCDSYEDLFLRNLGQMDRERVDGPELNLNESQVSLTNFMFQKATTKSDGDGEFSALIGLQEGDLKISDYKEMNNVDKKESAVVGDVASQNRICFVMSDKYGNINIEEESVTLDAGNTMWDPQDVTTIPNSVYAAEIEDSGDERTGRANTEIGVIARFQYIGGGKVKHLDAFSVQEDLQVVGKDNKNYEIDRTRMNYVLDKDTGEMTVYFPVIIKPLGIKVLDYPESIDLGFKASVTYTVDDYDIPIDTKNPIYFRSQVNVERPLDHTKWLTPEMIDQWLGFLNQSIAFTKQAVEYTQMASIGGVLTCTGAKFWHAYTVAQIKASCGDGADCSTQIQEANRKLYMICDRVACTGSPPQCDTDENSLKDMFNGVTNKDGKLIDTRDPDAEKHTAIQSGSSLPLNPVNSQLKDSQDNVLGNIDNVKFLGECTTDTQEPGYLVEVKSNSYDRNTSLFSNGFFGYKKIESQWEGRQCISKTNWDTMGASALGGGGVCFSTADPFYDDTRCNFFGMDEEGVADRDPATSIFSSIRCGCITDTYSHLKNYLKIQEAIKGCLEQAKIGETKGSYCERLMGIAICDVATNIVLPEVMKAYRDAPGAEVGESGRQFDFISQMSKTEKAMNGRYEGTVMSKSGLQTSQIINKACLGAITGDWSVLTDNIMSALDENEVEPIFGPPLPESRIQGYNPITGELSIQYRLTYAVVSGGQMIRTEVYLICDPSASNGEFCPSNYEETKELNGKTITPLYVKAGGTAQDTVILTDPTAKFWYNKLRFVHKYNVKEKEQTKTEEFSILHKGEVVPQCHFSVGMSSGAGFSCDTLFSDDALLSRFVIESETRFTPQNIFYEGDVLRMFLNYNIRGDGSQTKFNLHYITECNGLDGSKVYAGGLAPINTVAATSISSKDIVNPYGYALVNLFDNKPIEKLNVGSQQGVLVQAAGEGELKKNERYYIIVENLDSEKAKDISLGFVNKELFDIESPLTFTLQRDGVIGDDKSIYFTVLDNTPVNGLQINFLKGFENARITLECDSCKPSRATVSFNNPVTEVKGTISDVFKDVIEGQCKLYARILPDNVVKFTTLEEFQKYNPAGDDIESNVNEKDVKEYDFKILKKETTTTAKVKTDLVLPINKASYCFKNSAEKLYGQSFDLNLITQSSDNNIKGQNLIVNIEALSSDIAGSLLVGPVSFRINEANSVLKNFVGVLDLNKIYSKLKSNGMNKIEVKLRVEITDQSRSKYSNIDEKTLVFTNCGEELTLPQIPEVFSSIQAWIDKLEDNIKGWFGDISGTR